MGSGVWTSPDEQQELQASGTHGPAAFGAWGKGWGAGNRGTEAHEKTEVPEKRASCYLRPKAW